MITEVDWNIKKIPSVQDNNRIEINTQKNRDDIDSNTDNIGVNASAISSNASDILLRLKPEDMGPRTVRTGNKRGSGLGATGVLNVTETGYIAIYIVQLDTVVTGARLKVYINDSEDSFPYANVASVQTYNNRLSWQGVSDGENVEIDADITDVEYDWLVMKLSD